MLKSLLPVILMMIVIHCFTEYATAQPGKFTVASGTAMDISNLKWSIAENQAGQSPNILFELSFQDITSLSVYLKGNYQPIQNLTLFGYYQQGRTIRGRGRDVDYQSDNRQNATFDEIFKSNEGTKTVVNTGASYSFLKLSVLQIFANLAYLSNQQTFYLFNNDFSELNSTYSAYWRGGGVSLETLYKVSCKGKLGLWQDQLRFEGQLELDRTFSASC